MSYKILVIDDNIHNSKLIEGILISGEVKYDVFFAEDGQEGFDKAGKVTP